MYNVMLTTSLLASMLGILRAYIIIITDKNNNIYLLVAHKVVHIEHIRQDNLSVMIRYDMPSIIYSVKNINGKNQYKELNMKIDNR